MNNFEKFKNKEISQAESSKVMGASTSACTGGDTSWCVWSNFTSSSQACHIDPDWSATDVYFCQLFACMLAVDVCPI